jgi:hypothetical protein
VIRSRISTKTTGDDKVKEFVKHIAKAKRSYVTIGLHEDAGHYTEGANPPTVVEVGLWTEFGTKYSPERSWLRSTIDENGELLNKWRNEMMNNIMTKGWTVEKALEAMGFRIQVLLQNKIKSDVPPRIAPATAAAKVREGLAPVSLINTGLMLRSVTFKVVIAA